MEAILIVSPISYTFQLKTPDGVDVGQPVVFDRSVYTTLSNEPPYEGCLVVYTIALKGGFPRGLYPLNKLFIIDQTNQLAPEPEP